ncbi:S-methyl-5'-thioinosine phosphorylase [Gilvimarinus sp. F26214L]|uniref:S-methyl-5'-thioinosine phosphorylase n=1 Tax=Gilvimarinus sp. DZF01 TaxID=3461371 RepID=UPI0040451E96
MATHTVHLAVIGGSGFNSFDALEDAQTAVRDTPFGEAAPVTVGRLEGVKLAFMPRHGPGHKVPPHRINYRANIWALHELKAARVLAINAVGGIRADMAPGCLVCPDQIVDYTWGRDHTFFDDCGEQVNYTDFEHPYSPEWRQRLLDLARERNLQIIPNGVYGCTQGPRLETAAEIRRLRNDGCDLVGMTGMPEAILARELGLPYAALGLVVNWAAGLDSVPLSLDSVYSQLAVGVEDAKKLIGMVLSSLATQNARI